MKGIVKVLAILVAIGVVGAAGIAFVAFSFLNTPASDSQEAAVFEIAPGESFKTVARRLQEQGLVTSADKMALYGRLTGAAGKVRVGEYSIRRDSKPAEVLSILSSGKSIEYSITVPEGHNIYEIADILEASGRVSKADFLQLARDPAFVKEVIGEPVSSLEGYLFPETYHITKFTGAKGLIKMMTSRFKENFAKVVVPPGFGLKSHEIVILASIIEKETGAPEERPVISSVFHNRLSMNMRLQTDPTVVYGKWEKTGTWDKNISKEDLLTPTRYNTYTLNGLPHGPIANPGFEALKAAVAPANTEFLFFVSRNDGTHIFSKEYGQHQKAVTQFQLDRKAREGKSWRDLQNRQAAPEQVNAAPAMKPAPQRANASKPAAPPAKTQKPQAPARKQPAKQ